MPRLSVVAATLGLGCQAGSGPPPSGADLERARSAPACPDADFDTVCCKVG